MRKQRAFAPLTEAELDQVGDWLRLDTYDAVLERVRKPRPDRFGLDISRKPLETLHAKTNKIDKINQRIAEGQKLTLSEFDAINAGEKADVAEEIHDAIMQATYDLATSGDNTPAQLFSLQRLADFPARAEYRAHKVEMDLHRKQTRTEQLDLEKRSLALREKLSAARLSRADSDSDTSLESKPGKFRLWTPEELAINQPKIEAAFQAHPLLRHIGLPPTDTVSPTPDLSPCFNPPLSEPTATTDSPLSETLSETSSPDESQLFADPSFINTVSPTPDFTANSSPNLVPSPQCQIENAQFSMLNEEVPSVPSVPPLEPPSLEQRVNQYTLDRYHEAMHGKDPSQVGKSAARFFKSKMQWCPCGKDLPCSQHGDFPDYFWELISDDPDYTLLLRKKNLPYTAPNLLLQEQEKTAKRLAAEKSAPQWQMQNAQSSMLNEKCKSHAIRRWASYTLRPPGTPPPDDSWTNECPCGAKLPCDHHDDLWREVRYLRPSDPDYAAALARHQIPFHRPTEEELPAAPATPPSEPSPPASEPSPETLSESPSSVV